MKSEKATEFAVSPDGKWLAFVEGFQAYVDAAARTGRRLDIGPKADAVPVRRLTVNAGEYLHWSGDSATVHYTLGDELFGRALTRRVPVRRRERLPSRPRPRREARRSGSSQTATGRPPPSRSSARASSPCAETR